jgi:preprotein translocase subunit SecA
MVIFLGFLDGINDCLVDPLDLDVVEDDSELNLKIDFEKVYWKMHEAKADWLYNLDSWDNVLSSERRDELTRSYRQSKIVHREKIGRNDPCPCGSGKKYKNCCGKNT